MMTTTLAGMSPSEDAKKDTTPAEAERTAVRELVKAARARGEELTGPHGLLKTITKTVLESALEEEMTEHVGYDKHAVAGRNGANSRNGTRTKTVLTDNAGPVAVEVPRDRDGTFEPVIVKKRQRRLADVDAIVLSPYARGLTSGEISAHFAEVYGASVSKVTVSRITDKVVEDIGPGPRGRCSGSTRPSSSTRSWSRSVTARSATSRSTPRSGSTWLAAATCWGCGPGPVAVRAPSSGWPCSPT